MPVTSKVQIYKQPGEKVRIGMDFSNILQGGEVISSPSVETSPAGLTISTITTSGNFILMFAEGGTHGCDYRFEVSVDSDSGEELEADGILKVRDR